MRSYNQYCGLARSLDLIGDRWTLLIVRELLIQDCRYTDLLKGLPGIATNLLVTRLEEMEQGGLIAKETLPPPAATAVYKLTPHGQELRHVLKALGRWAAPLMNGRAKTDASCMHWLLLPSQFYLEDRLPRDRRVVIQVTGAHESYVVEAKDGRVRTRTGTVADPDVTLTGPADLALAVLMGTVKLADARKRGLSVEGEAKLLK